MIVDKYNGNFPENHNEILALKGVGEYTAAAIASFAFDKAYPVLDGNVFRFISRLFGIEKPIDTSTGKKEITNALDLIFNTQKPALFNQAIMEFGATHCTPKKPKCDTCIFNMQCEALGSKKVMSIPVKKGKTKILQVNHTYMCFIHDNKTYIEKRTAGIWKNLYQFPLIEEDIKPDGITKIVNRYLKTPSKFEISDVFDSTHILSHRKIQASFYTIHLDTSPIFLKNNIFEIPLADLTTRYPVSILTQNYLKRLNL